MDSYSTSTKQGQYNINRGRTGSIGGSERIRLIHGKRANSLMGDGHVENMNEEAFEAIGWPDGVFQRD
jgi:prepilin-type processing-associated H-X9-DG protein